jgi:anti-sigma-K factor RskA
MNCHELQDHYELYALGLAEEPERSEIRAHLNRKCEVCMPGVKRALEAAVLVGTTVPDAAPSRKLRGRILASVGAEPRRAVWSTLWAAATALLILLAVLFARRDWADRRDMAQFTRAFNDAAEDARVQRAEVARLTEAFTILNGPDTKEAVFGGARPRPARGKVFLNPSQGVLLIASNLPQTPAGKLYEMWVIPKAGKPVAAGMFQSNTDGSAMHVRPGTVDIQSTGAIAVTVEDQAGADQPTTTPLIMAPVEASPR